MTARHEEVWAMVVLKPDFRVHDRDALDEIELYGELIIAASASDGPLPLAEIDAVLGVHPVRSEPAAG